MSSFSPLISPVEAAACLNAQDVRVVDASWSLDGEDRRPDFERARLPGAVFFDLEASSDPGSGLPHMLPSPADFADRMGRLGLTETDRIIIYDSVGLWSAPRVWWMLRVMGANRAVVLDGGLPAWLAAGLPVESGPAAEPPRTRFRARLAAGRLAARADVEKALRTGELVVDARPRPRFTGEAAEPRLGLRSGHMPGAVNLPYAGLLTPAGTLKSDDQLRMAFAHAGVDLERPITTTCGSGVTAAVITLALERLGIGSRLYDGSWAEWGAADGGEVRTGA